MEDENADITCHWPMPRYSRLAGAGESQAGASGPLAGSSPERVNGGDVRPIDSERRTPWKRQQWCVAYKYTFFRNGFL